MHRSTKENLRDRQRFPGRIASTRGYARHLNRRGLEFADLKFPGSSSCVLWRIALARSAHARRTRRWTTQQGDCHLKRSGEQRPPLPPREWSLRQDGESTRRELLPCLAALSPPRTECTCVHSFCMHMNILCSVVHHFTINFQSH